MAQPISLDNVSILIPVKNGRQFVERTLPQIVEMARGAEVVIVDDGSFDGSFEFCQSFSQTYKNFRVVRSPGNGICDALNFGIGITTKEWIARCDIDDAYEMNKLVEQIELINSTKAILVFSDYAFYSEDGVFLGSIPGGVLSLPTKLSLVTGRRTPHPSAIFLKEACLRVGGYIQEDSPAEDLSLWLRICNLGDFATTDSILLKYRLSTTSTTLQNRAKSITQRTKVLNDYPISFEYFKEIIQQIDSITKQYSKMRAPGKRTALLLFDIYSFSLRYKTRIPFQTYLVMFRRLLGIRTLIACAQLFLEAKRRNRFRRNSLNRL
ncbi:Glycosyltransferase 2-like [Candidatus Nanopelagicaceae bacterium]